jgi:hypothetical protein
MLTGKMTAVWLIVVTMVSIVAVPLMIIYFAMLLPYDQAHPEAHAGEFILGAITLVPNISALVFDSGSMI